MRYPDIRRSKSLGATGELHSCPGTNKSASLYKAFALLSVAHHRFAGGLVL